MPRARRACSVYYGKGRDAYDVRGRVAHEAIFNVNDGNYRCPNSQQGYSPFTTWTRGLAWAMCGFAEQLEFLKAIGDDEIAPRAARGRPGHLRFLHRARHGRRRHPLLGHRRAEPAPAGRLAVAARRPVQRARAGGQLRGRHRRAGPAAAGPATRRNRTLLAGRPDRARHAARRAVSERRRRAPGPDPAQRLSSAERLGLRAARAGASPAASRACGAITTPARPRSTSSGSSTTSRI